MGSGHFVVAMFERLFGAPREQAPARAAQVEAPVIVIASGKGGTGKSFLSTSLAIVLHGMGLRTALVDCDFGLACDHMLLGVKPTRHLRHVLTGESSPRDALERTPVGPSLLAGVTGVRQMAALTEGETSTLGVAIGELATDHDVILLDSGAGLSPQNCAFLCAADHVLLVTQPEIAALTDAYAVVKTLSQLRLKPHVSVVVNRVQEAGHGDSTFQKLQEVASRHTGLSLHFLGAIADDPQVTQRRLGQLPLVATHPDSDVTKSVRSVARRLAAVAGPFEPRRREGSDRFATRLEDHRRLV